MKRILLMVVRKLWMVIPTWIKLCYHAAHPDKFTDEEDLKIFKYIVYHANDGGNVTIDGHGMDNIPKEGGFLITPNHQGMYDALAIMSVIDQPIALVAKKEVANVPLLKQVFACTHSFLLDRDDPREGLKVILGVAEELKKGRNYVIFPEGTRSKMGNRVGEFKGGSFKAAIKAKAPILPVALINSFVPFDENTIRPVTVQVHFLPPLYYEDYKNMKTVQIAALVQKQIQECILENEEK